ncbi:MAG: phosphatase PAP2 family protein [Actinomycetota bacterium]|nr:phosphatase PAP2 family protein [Actinomycetota bacterium]
MLSWQYAIATAAVLAIGAAAVRVRWGRRIGVVTEAALLFALYGLWQFAASFTVMSQAGALGRGRWVWHAERVAHLPTEASVQRLFLPHPVLVQAFDLYYDILHFPMLGACLIWLYLQHRGSYPAIRNTVALFTGASLLIQLIPVAPPRLLAGTGLVDTAARYGQSVYSWHGGFNADQYSAMPSVHVGWALIVAVAVITASGSRWRWLAAGYPALTLLVVVVTANHFWLDGIVAGLLVALVLAGQRLGRTLRRGPGRGAGDGGRPEPVRGEMSVQS